MRRPAGTFSLEERAMPTRNINLTDELDRYVSKKIGTGRYANASEVVRAGLRALEEQERLYEAKLARLRQALEEGERSGVAEGDVFARVRASVLGSRTSKKSRK
jgi:antitoxin ParD1/3/4